MNKFMTIAFALSSASLTAQAQAEPPQPSPNEIIVTARGIHMGRDIGRSEAVYSQLLKTFLVRNNIQGAETFRSLSCDGRLRQLPQDAVSRQNWIANIDKNLRGISSTRDGKEVKGPAMPLKFSVDHRYGLVIADQDELTKQVRHAVATRAFDGFMPLSEYLNKTTAEICPKP